MKKMILTTVIALFASATSFASNNISTYETAVGAETIIRQVLNKKLLGKTNSQVAKYMKYAIEGSGASTTHVDVDSIQCDRASGKDTCNIKFTAKGEDKVESEFSFTVQVRIYQGIVGAASVEDFSG